VKQLNSLLLVLLLANMSIIAEGQQESPPQERTPIKNNKISEETLTGILIVEDNFLYLIEETGATYAMNLKSGGPGDKPMDGGAPSGGRKGTKPQGNRPEPPDKGKDYAKYNGLEAVIHGMIMEAPPKDSPFGDIDGVIFPDSIIIDGKEIL